MLPNFLIIGAARCGTTTLYNQLQRHPNIYLPPEKRPEPHFFYKTAEYARGIGYYENKYFTAWRGQKAVGEASTSYVFGSRVAQRVCESLPGIKLICLLRNPIERAFSSYWHTVASGIERLPFAEAIEREQERAAALASTALGELAPFAYVERGLYHRQLERWFDEFDPAQMLVVTFDELVGDPRGVLADVARFLGVSPGDLPNGEIKAENKSVPIGAYMAPEVRRKLVEAFRDDVYQLGRLIGRDLTHWISDTDAGRPLSEHSPVLSHR